MLVAAGWLLTGCSSFSFNPVNWWHTEEGGKIAEERPAPPGADQPYPNIGTVPAKPAAPDMEAMKKITDSLVADRTAAHHLEQANPLPDPSSKIESPGLFGVGTAPPPSTTPAASVTMPSVSPPPAPELSAPPAPSAAAPRKPVKTTQLPQPAASGSQGAAPTAPAATPAATQSAVPPASAAAAPVTAMNMPAVAPARASIAPPAPPPAPTPKPMPEPAAKASATIVFVQGDAVLSAPAADEVKAFAAKRGTGTVSVIGYGDLVTGGPDAQDAALKLGLARAQAVSAALRTDGVPAASIRTGAEASGSGVSLQVLQ